MTLVLAIYFAAIAGLALFGLHRFALLAQYRRYRSRRPYAPAGAGSQLPSVLVQLPVYNERFVAHRLVLAAARLDYPPDRLHIQILDDSDDDTSSRLARLTRRLRRLGLSVEHLRREQREGFKAGALAAGLRRSDAEFCAIFDADFVPPRDFLRRGIEPFRDPGLGMVQARWGHLNRDQSLLTRLQSIFLDGHFTIEHIVRNRSGCFFNFNGTAGIWRRRCIEDAGGWQIDTLTEDLDLSYRAQLAGWRFLYLDDLVSDAELPSDMTAFKAQQHRWAKGSVQTARKLMPRVLRARLPWRVKLEAVFHLGNNLSYLFLTIPVLLWVPTLQRRFDTDDPWMLALGGAMFLTTLCVIAYHYTCQRAGGMPARRILGELPPLLSLGIGLSVNNGRAVFEGLLGHRSEFVRTPKSGSRPAGGNSYRLPRSLWSFLELGLACYFALGLVIAVMAGRWIAIPFLLLFLHGFLYVALASLGRPPERLLQFGSHTACAGLLLFAIWKLQAPLWSLLG